MSDTVIRVENLGQTYIIGHQKQERYTSLRDAIADKVRGTTCGNDLLKLTNGFMSCFYRNQEC